MTRVKNSVVSWFGHTLDIVVISECPISFTEGRGGKSGMQGYLLWQIQWLGKQKQCWCLGDNQGLFILLESLLNKSVYIFFLFSWWAVACEIWTTTVNLLYLYRDKRSTWKTTWCQILALMSVQKEIFIFHKGWFVIFSCLSSLALSIQQVASYHHMNIVLLISLLPTIMW